MSCYHPYKAFIVGTNPDTGKLKLKIRPYEVKYIYRNKNTDIERYFDSYKKICPNALNCDEKLCLHEHVRDYLPEGKTLEDISGLDDVEIFVDFKVIPCGKCKGCKVDKSREWANRIMLEASESSSTWFLTFTYDEEHVPKSYQRSEDFEETGEVFEHNTLRIDDITDFNKAIRQVKGDGIRFYCASEYGSRTFRPHYHVIYFNLELDDLKFWKVGRDGYVYWRSPFIEHYWKKGMVVITRLTWEVAAYVARYTTKKLSGNKSKEWYQWMNIEPEKARMSRRPGIGRNWYDKHKDEVYESYIIMLSTPNGGLKFKPPSYFDRLYEFEEPEILEKHKTNKIKASVNATRMKLADTDKPYLEYLETEEERFEYRTRRLERNKV